MPAELGRMERPEAEPLRKGRKLYLVPLVYAPPKPPEDLAHMHDSYWAGARQHVLHLEQRIGVVNHVYHEGGFQGGDEGLKALESMGSRSHEIARQKIGQGAQLEAIEDPELTGEWMDWQRCLSVGLVSKRVSELAWQGYTEASKKRWEQMAKRIDETLKDDEAGLLFVSDEHRLQFAADISVYYVAPPALDEIRRWVREQSERRMEQETQAGEGAEESPDLGATPGGSAE